MDELKQALDDVKFLKEILIAGTYNLETAPKALKAIRFLEAIEAGVNTKASEVQNGSK